MAIVRVKDLRILDDDALRKRFEEIEKEYLIEMTQLKSGGRAQNPGRIRELRRAVSKIKTIMRERELRINVRGTALKDTGKTNKSGSSEVK